MTVCHESCHGAGCHDDAKNLDDAYLDVLFSLDSRAQSKLRVSEIRKREREIPIRQHPVCVDSGTIGARAGGRSESKWIFSGIMPPEPDSVSL